MKKLLLVVGIIAVSTLTFSTVAYASAYNYARRTDYIFFFSGYVQVKPSFVEDGNHAANGYFRFRNGPSGDTGRLYAATGMSANDSRVYSRSLARYDDYVDFEDRPKVTFNYGFTWVPDGVPYWPE